MDKLLTLSATTLARMIREADVTSEHVTRTFIQQAKKVNPKINAIIDECYDEAIKQAKLVDKNLKKGMKDIPPYYGVPCSIKELSPVGGMSATAGLVHRKDEKAPDDAETVKRLKKAGAIPIGETNVPVIGMHYETKNKVYGQTNNPHSLVHSAGGSSGGEGALLACAGSAFGLGSDVGGSIRTPASFCGVFGHKGSSGLVPLTGNIIVSQSMERRSYLSVGPMSRHSEDLMPLLKILAGPDGEDESAYDIALGDTADVDIKKLTFLYVDHKNLHPEVKAAQDKTIALLKQSGASVKEMPLGKLSQSTEMMFSSLTYTAEGSLKTLGGGQAMNPIKEAFKALFRMSEYPWYTIAFALRRYFDKKYPKPATRANFEKANAFRPEFNAMLGKDKVLLYPCNPDLPIKHGQGLRKIENISFVGIFNILHNPATAFPVLLSKSGLPIGMQAVASHGNDHLTIATAMHLEKMGCKWLVPKMAG